MSSSTYNKVIMLPSLFHYTGKIKQITKESNPVLYKNSIQNKTGV